MKAIASALVLFASLQTFASEFKPTLSPDSYLHCYDGKVEIAVEAESSVDEIGYTTGRDLFNKDNVLKIKVGDQIYIFTKNVIVATDGFGNDAVQVFAQDPFGPLSPIIEFTFEHEGSYLDGYYSLPKSTSEPEDFYMTDNFEEAVYFQDDEMKCNYL